MTVDFAPLMSWADSVPPPPPPNHVTFHSYLVGSTSMLIPKAPVTPGGPDGQPDGHPEMVTLPIPINAGGQVSYWPPFLWFNGEKYSYMSGFSWWTMLPNAFVKTSVTLWLFPNDPGKGGITIDHNNGQTFHLDVVETKDYTATSRSFYAIAQDPQGFQVTMSVGGPTGVAP